MGSFMRMPLSVGEGMVSCRRILEQSLLFTTSVHGSGALPFKCVVVLSVGPRASNLPTEFVATTGSEIMFATQLPSDQPPPTLNPCKNVKKDA